MVASSPTQTLSVNFQVCTRMRRRAYANVSALLTFTNVPANACTKARQCAMSMNASANASVCVNGRVHGNVLVHSPLLRCLRIQLFPNYSPRRTAGRKGRAADCHTGAQNVKWQLKLDVCALSASSNSYKGLQLSEYY